MIKPIYVLGTHMSHDGSACLLKDGRICAAIEKERITRKKHDGVQDTDAILYCLEKEKIQFEDLDLIVQNSQYGAFFGERLISADCPVPVVTISHHLAHAYSSIGTCGFDQASVLVIDGFGNSLDKCTDLPEGSLPFIESIDPGLYGSYGEVDSSYYFDGRNCRLFCKRVSLVVEDKDGDGFHAEDSVGDMYAAASRYCFGSLFDGGKLMGLAPYGNPTVYKDELFHLKDGMVSVDKSVLAKFDRPARSFSDLKNGFQYYADIARWMQMETERAVLYIINSRHGMYPSDNLAYSGGVALNAVINAKITEKTPFKNLYVQPAAGDNGISIGCAFYGWMEVLKREKAVHNRSTCFGKIYSVAEAKESLYQFHAPEPVVLKEELDSFFHNIPAGAGAGGDATGELLVQFNVNNAGVYQVKMNTAGIESSNSIIGTPTSRVWVENTDLYYALKNPAVFRILRNKNRIRTTKDDELLSLLARIGNGYSSGSAPNGEYSHHLKYIHFEGEGYIEEAARLLAAGKIVGWFQDESEFGPRALGRRSILADARRRGVRNFINAEIKRREDFRPFAPAVLKEDVSHYFDTDTEAPYMLTVARIRDEWREKLEEIVHADGTCRVQTVTADWNPKFRALLLEFKRLTGVSVLLNTSFNGRAMPIVETPADALQFYYDSKLDYLVIQNLIIRKSIC